MSRSGVYHKAAYQSSYARSRRPPRGSHAPGTFWYYNNWDFNALATIFEKGSGMNVGQAFAAWIGGPIGMQDFSAADVDYVYEEVSVHPAYPFWISARDLARFGLLFLNDGSWDGEQLIPAGWISESTQPYSQTDAETDEQVSYGYMWWVRENGAYQARGTGQQLLHVDPGSRVVIVRRLDTCRHGEVFYPRSDEINELIRLIMAAHPDSQG